MIILLDKGMEEDFMLFLGSAVLVLLKQHWGL